MSMALETKNLSKRYGRKWALHDCTVRLPAGHVVALVGPNGAGKTTLLHLAVGLLKPSTGEVRVFGCDPHQYARETLPRVGFRRRITRSTSTSLSRICSPWGVR